MEEFILKLSSKTFRIVLLLFFTQLLSCAPGEEGSGSGIDAYIFVQNSFYEISDSKLHGSGSIRFVQSYGTGNGTSLELRGTLDLANSFITAVFFADMGLGSGLSLNIKRIGSSIQGTILYNGVVHNIIPTLWANPANIDIVIDAHRWGGTNRILIWQRDTYGYSPATALVDSNRPTDVDPSLPSGSLPLGTSTGLRLGQAEVTKANVGYARAL